MKHLLITAIAAVLSVDWVKNDINFK